MINNFHWSRVCSTGMVLLALLVILVACETPQEQQIEFMPDDTAEFEQIIISLKSGGKVIIDENGLSVIGRGNWLISRFDEDGSLHKRPETFEGGITVPLVDIGEQAPAGRVEIDHDGVKVYDANGELVSRINSEGSVHKVPESFEGGVTIPLAGGGRVEIDHFGITVFDENGQSVININQTGSLHNVPEDFTEVTAEEITVPLASGGKVRISDGGVAILDANGNFVSTLTDEGSAHHFPEEFSEIKVPLAGGGWVEIDHFGITIFDENGKGVINMGQTGSLHIVPEDFTEISAAEISAATVTVPMDYGGKVVIDGNGISVIGLGGITKVRLDGEGSYHEVPEHFGQPITVSDYSSPEGNNVVIGGKYGVTADTGTFTKLNVEMMDPLLMESFPVSVEESYESGDVLVIDPQSSGTVRLCYKAQDTGIIGVVAPDVTVDENGEILVTILGAQGPLRQDGTRLEALVKADASYGIIRAGDLLTTSPTPGHAMKATDPQIGTVLGKALESLTDGQGLIKVFIDLQ